MIEAAEDVSRAFELQDVVDENDDPVAMTSCIIEAHAKAAVNRICREVETALEGLDGPMPSEDVKKLRDRLKAVIDRERGI